MADGPRATSPSITSTPQSLLSDDELQNPNASFGYEFLPDIDILPLISDLRGRGQSDLPRASIGI
jgi:hypothetical protein